MRILTPLDLLPMTGEKVKEALVHNSEVLSQVTQATSSQMVTLRSRQLEQNRLLNTLVNKVKVMSGLLGAPPSGVDTATVWQAVAELQDSKKLAVDQRANNEEPPIEPNREMHINLMDVQQKVEELASQLKGVKQASVDSAQELKAVLPEHIRKLVWHEFRKLEQTFVDADEFFQQGGRLELENHIRYLTDTLHASIQRAMQPQPTAGNIGLDVQEITDMKKLLSKIEEHSRTQQVRLSDLEARSELQAVEIEGFKFTSPAQVKSFVLANNIPGEVLKFVDAMSFLEMASTVSQSYTDNVDVQYRGSRSAMERPSDQKALYSFQLTAPTIMAGTPDQARTNLRKLYKWDSYEKFKGSGARDSGAASELRKLLNDKQTAVLAEIKTSVMSREAKMVAQAMLTDAKRFLDTLLIYMKDQVEEYGSDTNLSETRRWDLVQNIVRIVFEVISQPRRVCSEITIKQASGTDRAHELLWAMLQANKMQNEFLEHEFKNHPKVGPMLTHFLLDVVSFHDDVDPLIKDVQKAVSDAGQAKRKLDALESQVKNMQSRLPSKKGKAKGEGETQA